MDTAEELGVPRFARVEIALAGRDGLPGIADQLRELADTLTATALSNTTDETAMLVAYRKIRAASKNLRG